MTTPMTLTYPAPALPRSLAAAEVADLFGLGEALPPCIVADRLELDVSPSNLVLFTGPSGSGKSTLLRAVGNQLGAIDAATLPLDDRPLIDHLPGSVTERLGILSACGLAEARLALLPPSALSDGQRARFRIAIALTLGKPIALDEFGAVLDRTLARVVAFNLRKQVTRTGVGALCATTHDDLIDDLDPDIHVVCHGDGVITVTRRERKKKSSASSISSGFRKGPDPTGRTSLGGITAAITSGSPGV